MTYLFTLIVFVLLQICLTVLADGGSHFEDSMAPIINVVRTIEERQNLTRTLLQNPVSPEAFKIVKVEKKYDTEIQVVLLVTAIILILLSCIMLSNVYASHKRAQRW